ncbi:MAG: RNA polymerase-binding protein DksA [Sulfuricurvum sp.]
MQQSELKYFKEILLGRKAQIIKNLQSVSESLGNMSSSGLSDEADIASLDNSVMIDSAIASQQQRELEEINISLGKIESGEYGICEMCEESIGFQRLKVKPHATYCIDCREIVEKSRKG